MKRVYPNGYWALISAGTAQPVFGTKLTATLAAPYPSRDGAYPVLTTVTVTSTVWFKKGDWVLIDPLANQTTAFREQVMVYSITDATHIVLQGLQFGHANGVWLQLAIPCTGVYVQMNPANVGLIAIGLQGVVESNGHNAIAFLNPNGAGVQPTEFVDPINGLANVMKTDDYWFDGAHTGDSILPSCTVQ